MMTGCMNVISSSGNHNCRMMVSLIFPKRQLADLVSSEETTHKLWGLGKKVLMSLPLIRESSVLFSLQYFLLFLQSTFAQFPFQQIEEALTPLRPLMLDEFLLLVSE
jgi:hypothetical protein